MNRWIMAVCAVAMIGIMGCAINFSRRSPWDIKQLSELSDELDQFKTLARLKAEETNRLMQAKEGLASQLSDSDASIGYDSRGVVARLLNQVLFDSGQAELKWNAKDVLNRVASVIQEVPEQPLGVEGHTDNEAIKFSSWANNKELSLARAQVVADYLISKGIDTSRITVIGYGEVRPIESNDTIEGRQINRRVEIIILPQSFGEAYEDEADRLKDEMEYSK